MKKIFITLLLTTLGYSSLTPMHTPRGDQRIVSIFSKNSMYDKAALAQIAIESGLGFKSANLIEQKKILAGCTFSMPIEIPTFKAISSQAIQTAITTHTGFNVAEKWAAVVDAQTSLSESFWTKQKRFIHDLDAALTTLLEKIKIESLSLDTLFADASLSELQEYVGNYEDFIQTSASNNQSLMVRSTGKEDTEDCANAGGNETKANITPNRHDVLEAIKEVIMSYFSAKSLTQRESTGDKTIFNPDVLSPILLQVMIKETESEEITRCGVMHTEEPNTSYKERNKSTGITLIEAAFGNNSAVVESKIPCDKFYAVSPQDPTQDPWFTAQIKIKTKRLLPNGTYIENAEALKRQPALTEKMIITLKQFANILEKHYGYAVDVEFVIKNNTIFIVQVRPLVKNSPSSSEERSQSTNDLPCYVDFTRTPTKFRGSVETVIAQTPTPITDLSISDLEFVSILEKALTPNAPHRNIVCCEEDISATSHPATVLKGQGKSLFRIDSATQAKLEQAASNGIITLDPQRNTIFATPFGSPVYTLPGWLNYPIKRMFSLVHTTASQEVHYSDMQITRSDKTTRELLETIRSSSDAATIQATTGDLLKNIIACWHLAQKSGTIDEDLHIQWQKLYSKAAYLCEKINELGSAQEGTTLYLHRLLALRFLEALIYQQPYEHELVDGMSLATLTQIRKQEAETHAQFASCTTDIKAYLVQLKKVESLIFNDFAKSQWNNLLQGIATNIDLTQELATLIFKLQKASLLSTWLHTDFPQAFNEHALITQETIAEFIELQKQKYDECLPCVTYVSTINNDLQQFDALLFNNEEAATQTWTTFWETVGIKFVQPEFIEQFKATNNWGRLTAIQTMKTLVDTIDGAIKSVKGNPNFTLDKKLPLFKDMLEQYYLLLNAWISEFVINKKESLALNGTSSLKQYFKMMEAILAKNFIQEDLDATPGIEISNFSIGCGHDFSFDMGSAVQPKSGEDVFSIIHQSILHCYAVLTKQNFAHPPMLPEILEKTVALYERASNFPGTTSAAPVHANLVGYELDQSKTTIHYNTLLGQHSCQTALSYEAQSKNVIIKLNFYGGKPDEYKRWCKGAALVALISPNALSHGIDAITITKLSNQALLINLTFKSTHEVEYIERFLHNLIGIAKWQVVDFVHYADDINCAAQSTGLTNLLKPFQHHGLTTLTYVLEYLLNTGADLQCETFARISEIEQLIDQKNDVIAKELLLTQIHNFIKKYKQSLHPTILATIISMIENEINNSHGVKQILDIALIIISNNPTTTFSNNFHEKLSELINTPIYSEVACRLLRKLSQ